MHLNRTSIAWMLVALCPVAALSAESDQSSVTPEARQKMAETHQKMADCLKSDKPMSECEALMSKAGCSMMKTKKKGHEKAGVAAAPAGKTSAQAAKSACPPDEESADHSAE